MDILVNKAYIFISITILSLFILTGCNLRINARKEAEDIVATVIEYINKRDSEGLIALFCEEVKEKRERSGCAEHTIHLVKQLVRLSRYRSLLYSKSLLMSWVRMILLTSGFATEFSIFASAMIIP